MNAARLWRDDVVVIAEDRGERYAEAPRLARAAGLEALHDFLARGFRTFRAMRGADEFLATIAARETRIIAQLYDGAPQPFALD